MNRPTTKWLRAAAIVIMIAVPSFLGGIWYAKVRLQSAEEESLRIFQHLTSQKTADAYVRLMEAMENGDTNQLSKLRSRAAVVIQGYVQETRQLRDGKGYQWCPNDPEILRRAEEFLAEHPMPATKLPPAR